MKQLAIIGNLGQDAILKNTNGEEFLQFSVGVNERRKKNGENIDETTWITVFTYQKNLYDYLLKGTKVYVQGNARFGASQDDMGRVWSNVVISAILIQLLSSKASNEPAPQATAAPATAKPLPAPPAKPVPSARVRPTPAVEMAATQDDDLPF